MAVCDGLNPSCKFAEQDKRKTKIMKMNISLKRRFKMEIGQKICNLQQFHEFQALRATIKYGGLAISYVNGRSRFGVILYLPD